MICSSSLVSFGSGIAIDYSCLSIYYDGGCLRKNFFCGRRELVRGRAVDVVDYEKFARPFGGFQFQSELLLESSEHRGPGSIRRDGVRAKSREHTSRTECRGGFVGHEFRMEIEFPLNSGLVGHRTVQYVAETLAHRIECDAKYADGH